MFNLTLSSTIYWIWSLLSSCNCSFSRTSCNCAEIQMLVGGTEVPILFHFGVFFAHVSLAALVVSRQPFPSVVFKGRQLSPDVLHVTLLLGISVHLSTRLPSYAHVSFLSEVTRLLQNCWWPCFRRRKRYALDCTVYSAPPHIHQRKRLCQRRENLHY